MPTFSNSVREEVIDVTLSTLNLAQDIRDWKVSLTPSLSDHRFILFKTDGEIPDKYARNPRHTRWESFRADIDSKLGAVPYRLGRGSDIEAAVESLSRDLTAAYEENCPLRKVQGKGKATFWTKDLEDRKRAVHKLLSRVKHRRGSPLWEEYKKALQEYKKEIRRASRESWRHFCQSINDIPATARIHRVLCKDTKARLGSLHDPSGGNTTSEEDTLRLLMDTHFPGSTVARSITECMQLRRPSREDWRTAREIVTFERTVWAVDSFAPYKSPGLDGVFPAMLQQGRISVVPYLLNVFRACVATGFTPRSWRQAKVVFIPKPGRDRYTGPKDFRPITLSSFVLKTLERIVDRYLRDGPLERCVIHANQFAYQAGKSTDLALHNLVGRLEKTLDQREVALVAFLDIEGAFNCTTTDSIRQALVRHGVGSILIDWVLSTLEGRVTTAMLNNVSCSVNVARGCPQGGVLSPLLWCIVVNELLVRLNSMGVYVQAYADDVSIVVRGRFCRTVSEIMQGALRSVESWCREVDLSVNAEKTELILFTRRRRLDGLVMPTFFGTRLVLSQSVKYLGIILDCKLNWREHVEHKVSKARNSMWACRRVVGVRWGLKPKVVYWLYTTIVRPSLLYGSLVWWPCIRTESTKAKLNKIQRLACISITSAVRTTPLSAMEALLDLPPLDLVIRGEARVVAHRLWSQGSWAFLNPVKGHTAILVELDREDPVLLSRGDRITPKYRFNRKFIVEYPTREEWDAGSRGLSEVSGQVWYTDGSVTEEGSGAGVSGPRTRLSLPLGEYTTIFQAEIFAILACVSHILEEGGPRRRITILSDSQAAMKALSACKITSSLVLQCREALDCLAARHPVSLIWVPGHAGIRGNETADTLAKTGSASKLVGPEPALGVTAHKARRKMETWVARQHSQKWRSISRHLRQARELIEGPSAKDGRFCLSLGRANLRLLVGLLSGHNTLRRHLHVMGVAEDPLCERCGVEEETSAHVLCRCEALSYYRQTILGSITLDPQDVKELGLKAILNFAKRARLVI
ncbi:unnamed protein product [Acanthoscelides obtectus]|uniref:Lian-aa1 retrotransposon protein n=1 Tax=Acanthoscelides obtectus TaxID=200917 RepID=A0A9P0KK03_ACAOB|nr:unnamed protein product [Acanthoscelides obtectus]CAK1625673.1 hypothetical protein AOBTE_LOCUS3328 [Acanthoscelides obtectus]